MEVAGSVSQLSAILRERSRIIISILTRRSMPRDVHTVIGIAPSLPYQTPTWIFRSNHPIHAQICRDLGGNKVAFYTSTRHNSTADDSYIPGLAHWLLSRSRDPRGCRLCCCHIPPSLRLPSGTGSCNSSWPRTYTLTTLRITYVVLVDGPLLWHTVRRLSGY